MEVIHERCAGMDISKRDAKVCVRVPGARPGTYGKRITVHGAMHRDIAELRDYLASPAGDPSCLGSYRGLLEAILLRP